MNFKIIAPDGQKKLREEKCPDRLSTSSRKLTFSNPFLLSFAPFPQASSKNSTGASFGLLLKVIAPSPLKVLTSEICSITVG